MYCWNMSGKLKKVVMLYCCCYISRRNVIIVFTSRSRIVVASSGLILESISPMTNNTLQHGLSGNLDDCFVDVEYILYKVVTAKCCWSTYAVNVTLTLIPYLRLTCKEQQINVRRIHIKWMFFNAHEPKQQHYTCNIPRSLTHKSHQSCLVWGNHCNFKIFGDYRTAHRGSSTLTRT